ncbi:MAG: hypothetical protein LKJ83_02670 [Eubacteriaceae bacterium]|jgi:hypothetical protein|nr:hypothetical protein [Eubacteriaceae bacterium]
MAGTKDNKTKRNGTDNLIPMSKRSKEEVRAIGKKGGIQSGVSRREKKKLRDELELLLENPETMRKVCNGLIEEACKGNAFAFKTIRDTIGQAPEQMPESTTFEIRPPDQIDAALRMLGYKKNDDNSIDVDYTITDDDDE